MWRWIPYKLFTFLWPVVAIYAVVCLAAFILQRQLIYHPVPMGSKAFDVVKVETGTDFFAASMQKADSDRAVIYFGGNAEDVSSSMHSLTACFADQAVYAMHYRGFGASPGRPNERQLHRDAQALYDHVVQRYPKVTLVGRSLGSGVATPLASNNKVERLVLVTPFDSLANVGQSHFPFLPVKLLLSDRFDSAAVAKKIEIPVIVLRAAQDEVIPASSTHRLVKSFRQGICKEVVMDPASHNSFELTSDLLDGF